MRQDKILWHTLSKNTNDPIDNLCKVDFTLSHHTETFIEIFQGGFDNTVERLRKAVKERGYDFVNIDCNRKVLYVRKL